MKLCVWSAALGVAISVPAVHASNATAPIDYTRRNAPFASQPGISPEKTTPTKNRAVQDARVEKDVRAKQSAPAADQRSAIGITEAREKHVVSKESDRPAAVEQPKSGMNQRIAGISTAADTMKPPIVSRYQDSLAAASATNMARFPALDAGTKPIINRFVFRKNGTDVAPAAPGTAIPVAGGSPVKR